MWKKMLIQQNKNGLKKNCWISPFTALQKKTTQEIRKFRRWFLRVERFSCHNDFSPIWRIPPQLSMHIIISSHVHHMFITCRTNGAVHGYFLTAWWPEVIVFVTPKMGSTSNTKYSNHQFATQSLGKMKFPHLLPPKKNTPPKSFEHFQPAGNAADPPIGGTVGRCQYLCTWKVFLPNFTKWLQ